MEYNAQKEPTLEEYGLELDSYLKHREQINVLISERDSTSFSFWKYLFYIILPVLLIFYFIFSVQIIILIIFVIICLLFFESVKDYFNKINENYQGICNRIKNYKDKTNVGSFEDKLLKHYIGYVDYYYRVYVFRKHIGRGEGMYLASLINETKNVAKFFNSPYSSGYKEYLIKRFNINPDINYEINSNYFSFTKILHSINGIKYDNKKIDTNNENKISQNQNTELYQKVAETIFKEKQTPISSVTNNKLEKSENAPSQKQDNENKEGVNFWGNLMKGTNTEIDGATTHTSKTKEITNTIDVVSPDKKYNTPRKIDWENINKNKSITGLKGEEIVFEIEKNYLKSINKEDLAEKVKHMSLEGDGSGYDILSFFPDGREKYIEVKSSKNSSGNSFNISSNELDFMKRNQNNYHIYQVFNINDNEETPTLKVHRASDILEFKKITPVQYVVKME
ncbi:MAG: DUF3883 domain-containing protein [Candidatus Nomurabacteria bacterium]|nr:DUF3883 domain-containing protein [Candidatus Nomurabacteria bacterium]